VLLTIDIGTSIFKSAVWDFEGGRKAFASVPLSINTTASPSSDNLRHETDSGQWLKAFEECCKRLCVEIPLKNIEALVISGNGPSLTPVLTAPHSLSSAPVRLWLDRRGEKAAEQVSLLLGSHVDAGFFLPKAFDIKINEPELYEKTKYFLGCPEFFAFALTGEARTVFPSDGFEHWYWNDSILEKLELDKEKFPPFIRPGEIVGSLISQTAAQFGFKTDIPVIAGGPDFFPAILGAGAVKPGQICDRAGTSEGINLCTENFISDKRLMCYGHPVKPYWNLSGIITTTGKAIEWGCRLLGIDNHSDFFALAEMADAGSGGLVFLPYLAGERAPVWNPSARGMLRGLNLSAGRPEFARSILEGICFAIRDVIETMEENNSGKTGTFAEELRIAGVSSGSILLNQLKADISGKPALVPKQKEAELLGLAIIGSCTLGKYSSFTEAVSALVQIEKSFKPNKNNEALYNDLFNLYQRSKKSCFQ